ncbi:AFG1 family ATPase [Flagellatimonas centrodinii]|uniref:cell division protein ZapE n=1 Tax=Flagellatimonas centrodinii TaxID=2806210 RepID=UPI001FEF5AF2|nr:cell division protein ZapE [Flagellatimonas centrodinii]ULQ46764.1 AFG1 family ATPase [Flagellatimonas centrodinii]
MSRPPSPATRYAADLQQPGFQADAAQAEAVAALQQVYEQLLQRKPRRSLSGRLKRPWPAVSGLYLWGGVGRGKTYLMDAFYEALPFRGKRRTHFHRFMLDVQARRRRYPDTPDPLLQVAREIATEVRVLCFDEFFVSDIADAMILGRLFEALFAEGICLIATSNLPPDQLYRDGLQRQHFLPAIDTLKRHVRVLNVDGGVDYRLRTLTQTEIYHAPCDAAAEANLAHWFSQLAPDPGKTDATLTLHDRPIRARRLAEGVGWFDFSQLCEGPRGVADYIELARTHHTILLSRVPQLGLDGEDPARRFVHLVDEFYDRSVKLVMAADVPLVALYGGEKLRFEFERTRSRLLEMQSAEYLARPHIP